jgi:hypothetical protein
MPIRVQSDVQKGNPPHLPKARPEPVEGCHGQMRVISFIEDQDVIKKILNHPGLWGARPIVSLDCSKRGMYFIKQNGYKVKPVGCRT